MNMVAPWALTLPPSARPAQRQAVLPEPACKHPPDHPPNHQRGQWPNPAPRPAHNPAPNPASALPVWHDARPLDQLLGQCRRQGRPSALLLIELQPANPDSAAALALAVGQRLRHQVRAQDDVAQTATCSFAVLLRDVGDLGSVQVRRRLELLLRRPYRVGADLLEPLLRIGRAVPGLDGEQAAQLLRVAALRSNG